MYQKDTYLDWIVLAFKELLLLNCTLMTHRIFLSTIKKLGPVVCKPRLAWWLGGKESACNADDMGWIPGMGRSPGEGNGIPLLCSCLENPIDRD